MKTIILFFFLILFSQLSFSFTGKGTGTENDPYQITNINELQQLKDIHKLGIFIVLMNDIDATETRNWNIGDHDGNPNTPDEPQGFYPIEIHDANFDGKGFIITNLYINIPTYPGVSLFGNSSTSEIRRLGLENCDITGGGMWLAL